MYPIFVQVSALHCIMLRDVALRMYIIYRERIFLKLWNGFTWSKISFRSSVIWMLLNQIFFSRLHLLWLILLCISFTASCVPSIFAFAIVVDIYLLLSLLHPALPVFRHVYPTFTAALYLLVFLYLSTISLHQCLLDLHMQFINNMNIYFMYIHFSWLHLWFSKTNSLYNIFLKTLTHKDEPHLSCRYLQCMQLGKHRFTASQYFTRIARMHYANINSHKN